jgi:hypothetical protein
MSSSNLFQQVLNDAKGVEAELLGPVYPYYKNIKDPAQLGMSDKGTIQQMSKDISGLTSYVELLVSGKSSASKTGKPLGNKFFLQTGAKCLATDTCNDPSGCQQVDRYIYIDNVPSGSIPFISNSAGINFTDFEGLIPGAMGDLEVFNPFGLMRAFLSGATPKCQQIKMQTINNKNEQSSESHYVTLTDIGDMDPCTFSNGVNPVTNVKCKESFQPMYFPKDDLLAQIYFASLGALGIYMLYRLSTKNK